MKDGWEGGKGGDREGRGKEGEAETGREYGNKEQIKNKLSKKDDKYQAKIKS